MILNDKAKSIKQSLNLTDLDAALAEIILFYDFKDKNYLKLLTFESNDVKVLLDKRLEFRKEKDFKSADYIRDVLLSAGIKLKDEKIK